MQYVIIYLVLLGASQTILKSESNKNAKEKTGRYLLQMINWRTFLAYSISGLNIFVWLFSLKELSLFKATMLVSFSYVMILLIDRFFFKENVTMNQLLGVTFIIIGILLTI